ncbi:MAG: methyltransferase domain-containing protein [Phycisphaerales bacterium]
MREPAFVTTVYGQAYAAFLAPHLHSIRRQYPEGGGFVLWQDVPAAEIALLSRAFPLWRFVEATEPMTGGVNERIPRKLHAWKRACEMAPGRPVALLDCDTLLVRRLDEFFEGAGGWDIIYTWKDELFPINTGVMLASTGAAGAALFGAMAARVERLIRDPDLLRVALGSSGAADQHALREIVGFCSYDKHTVRTVAGRELVFRGVPCKWLNETNCRPMSGDLCIVHYKTGWHPILLEGKDWTVNRPRERCREMFEHWERTRADAERAVAREAVAGAARAARERLAPIAGAYEERGILHSEMLAVCGVCGSLGVDLVIESGRARGQSTLVLARFFEGTGTRIVSIELERGEDAAFAEERLRGFAHVELVYGDSFRLLPEVIRANPGKRIAVLLDGPKGIPAIEFLDALFEEHGPGAPAPCDAGGGTLVAGFIHDMRKQTPQRERLEARPGRLFFTDDEPYTAEFGDLDRACLPREGAPITMHTWRPFKKGEDPIPSYGPTLAVVFPGPPCHRAPCHRLGRPGSAQSSEDHRGGLTGARTTGGPSSGTATLAPPRLIADPIPNRFLHARDWRDPRYAALRDEFAVLYRDEMHGEPHPYGARDPQNVITHWSREWEYPWAALNARPGPGMAVVDLGCGGSPLAIWMARRLGCDCTGVDLIFESKTGRNNLRGFTRPPAELFPEVAWLRESMAALSLGDASQDRALCISVLEHVPTEVARATFREIARVLRPGGLALITTDVDGEHRTLTSSYRELIAMAAEAGLRLEGKEDWTPPAEKPGLYDVVGFVLKR